MTQPRPADTNCRVCSKPLQTQAQADCYLCGDYFHLGLTADADVEDCGQVWIDDEVLALQFACNHCLEAQQAPAKEEAPAEEAPAEPSSADAPRVQRARPGRSVRDLARRRRNR